MLTDQLRGLSPGEQERAVLDLVRGHAAAVLGGTTEELDLEPAFLELGFSSFTALELCNALGAATGLEVTPAVVFEHPSPAALAAYLRIALCEQDNDPSIPLEATP